MPELYLRMRVAKTVLKSVVISFSNKANILFEHVFNTKMGYLCYVKTV